MTARRGTAAVVLVAMAIAAGILISIDGDDGASRAPSVTDGSPTEGPPPGLDPSPLPDSTEGAASPAADAAGRIADPSGESEDTGEKLRRYAEALQANPTWAEGYRLRGRLLLEVGRVANALADFHRGLEVDPRNREMWRESAKVWRILGHEQRAAAMEARARELPERPVGPVTLTGEVVGPDRRLVTEATLRLWMRGGGVREVPVRGGRYEVELETHPGMAQATSPGFAPSPFVSIESAAGTLWTARTLRLRPACRLRGTVRTPDGVPLEVTVTARLGKAFGVTARSRPDGSFVIEDLVAGLHTVSVEGYPDHTVHQVAVSVEHGGEVALTVFRGVGVSGTVRDARGEPVANARLQAVRAGAAWSPKEARTGADGRYTFDILPGPIDLRVRSADSALCARLRIEVGAAPFVEEIVLEPAPRLTGRVLRAGLPLANVGIALRMDDGSPVGSVTTDREGAYAFSGLLPGSYQLGATVPGRRYPVVEVLILRGGDVVAHDIMVPLGALAGHVTDAEGGAVSGAWVVLKIEGDDHGAEITANDGAFRLENLPLELLTLYVRHPSLGLLARRPIDLRGGPIEDLSVVARPGATVRGRLIGPQGQPVAGFKIRIRPLDFELSRSDTTDADGRFELGPLYDARYGLVAGKVTLAQQASQLGLPALRLEAPEFEVYEGKVEEIEARLLSH